MGRGTPQGAHRWWRAACIALVVTGVLAGAPRPGAAAPPPGGSPPGGGRPEAVTPAESGVLLRLTFRQGETRRYATVLDVTGAVEEQAFERAGGPPRRPPEVDRFTARLRLDSSVTVLAVLPDGSANVRATADEVSLTVDGAPFPLPPLAGRALPLRLRPDGSLQLTDATVDALDPDGPPQTPGALPGLPAVPLPSIPIPLNLPGLSSLAVPLLPYPTRPLRPGESLADEVRLTAPEFPFPALIDGALRRRVTLTLPPAGAGPAVARLTTGVVVPVGGRWDEPGLTLRGSVEVEVTQDVDRATGWPVAADGVMRVAGALTEDDPAERTSLDLQVRLTLRER